MINKFAKTLPIIILIIIIIIGLALVIISYLPFELVKTEIDIFTQDGTFDFFTAGLLLKSRFVGIAIIIICWIFSTIIKESQQLFSSTISSCPSFFKEIGHNFRKIIKKENKIHLYTFVIIMTIAIAIRLYFLLQPIRYIEASTFIYYAQKPLFIGLSDYSYTNNHLFHTFLVHIAYLFFGSSLWAVRLPALIFGILIIPMTYIVARMFYNKYVALLSAGIVASSSILIEYSSNATGYTTIIFFSIAITALAKYLINNKNSFAWLLFAILSILGFYTKPIMLYSFGIVIIWLLASIVFRDTKLTHIYLFKNLIISLIITFISTFILYLPVLLGSLIKQTTINKNIKLSWSDFITVFPSSMHQIWSQWNRDIPIVISILLIIGFFTSLIFHKKITNYKIPIILAAFTWLTFLLLIQRTILPEHGWLFLLPLFIVVSSAGIIFLLGLVFSKMRNYKSLVFSIIALILSIGLGFTVFFSQSIFYSNEKETLRDAEEITIMLKYHLKSGDRIVASPPSDLPLVYYFNKHNISTDYLLYTDFYSSTRVFIIENKSIKQTINDVLKYHNLSLTGFSKPELFSEFASAYIYKTNNLKFESKLILDFREYSNGEFQNSKLSSDKKEIIIEEGENKLKICKIPITINSGTDYLISFKIKKTENLDNVIYFDLFGEYYDRPEQEFNLKPEKISEDYTQIVEVLNSNKVPPNIDIYFRIFTYSTGEAIIKDLEIYDITTCTQP